MSISTESFGFVHMYFIFVQFEEERLNTILAILAKFTFQKQLPKVFNKKSALENFTKFTGKHLCLRPTTSLKKRLWHSCFL